MRWLYVVVGLEVALIAWLEWTSSVALVCALLIAWPLLYVGWSLTSSGRELKAAVVTWVLMLVWTLVLPAFIPRPGPHGCGTHHSLVGSEILVVGASATVVLALTTVRRWVAWMWRPALSRTSRSK